MKVFITWSSENSRRIALALHDLIGKILQTVEPFMSEKDVDRGTRWQAGLASELDTAAMGIICLTPDNLSAPWLLFESGALSNKFENAEPRVYTYLNKVNPADIIQPLSMFQHTLATKEDTRVLIQSIHTYTKSATPGEQGLNELFDLMWPKMQAVLDTPLEEAKVTHRDQERC